MAICSALLSLYSYSAQDLINGDGIRYVTIARVFLSDGVGAAFAIYHWPFYSILIGVVHKLTGLGFENSAIALNTLLLVVVCVVFVRVYEEIRNRDARLWVAAMLILALPILNDYRELVIRGYGFWACMLVALYYFIQYSRSPGLQPALKWQLGIAAAILFRIEGVAFLVLAPFCLLFMQEMRGKIVLHLFRLNGLFLLLGAAGLLALLISGGLTLPDSVEIPNQLDYVSPLALLGALNTEAGLMYGRNRFMASVDEARLVLAAGVLALVIVKTATNTGLAFLAVWGYGVYRKWIRLTRESYIVLYFAAIGFLTLVPVAGNYFFVSSRYTVLTVLLLSLITFQYVDYLLRELSRRQLHKWSLAAGVVILVLFLDGVISGGNSKRNIRVAGERVASSLATEERIACNEARLKFYSGDRCQWITLDYASLAEGINELKIEGYTYLLLWIDRKDEQLRLAAEADGSLVLEMDWPNKKGSSVRLYKVVTEGN
ncbi:hypothetical protein N9089_02385 [Crocinitomicaceae bacterium]|nr:hypothetical protein [Crocinitomicaceae bacterium]